VTTSVYLHAHGWEVAFEMRIGIVSQDPFPTTYDFRCVKIVETLAAAGHHVTVFTPEATPWRPGLHQPGIQVLAAAGNHWRGILTEPWPFNPYWTMWVLMESRRRRLDCLLSPKLRLAGSTWLAARLCGIRFWLDLAENYPAMVRVERSGQALLPGWVAISAFLERFCAQHADLVTVVVKANADRLIRMGIQADRLVIVSNTPILQFIPQRKRQFAGDSLHLVYAGLLSKVRGLDNLLVALSQIDWRVKLPHLNIIGDGPDRERIRNLCLDLRLEKHVTFHGWISREELLTAILRYDVGVIPHLITEHTQTTIPNKLFDYMLCGLPVWVTAMRPCQEVVEQVGCGWVSGDDVESLTNTLRSILSTSPTELQAMGDRARLAVQNHYNWGVDSKHMLQAVESLSEPS